MSSKFNEESNSIENETIEHDIDSTVENEITKNEITTEENHVSQDVIDYADEETVINNVEEEELSMSDMELVDESEFFRSTMDDFAENNVYVYDINEIDDSDELETAQWGTNIFPPFCGPYGCPGLGWGNFNNNCGPWGCNNWNSWNNWNRQGCGPWGCNNWNRSCRGPGCRNRPW